MKTECIPCSPWGTTTAHRTDTAHTNAETAAEKCDKTEIHRSVCDQLNDTYRRKNHDYGDSFAQLRRRYPQAICMRLWDKLLRLDTLMGGEKAQVTDESIRDTLVDLANYAIMEIVEMEAEP